MPEFSKMNFIEWLKLAVSSNRTPFEAIAHSIGTGATTVTEDLDDRIFRAQTAFMRWVSGDCV